MLSVELKVNGRSIGAMNINRTACQDNEGVYEASVYEQTTDGIRHTGTTSGVEHWRPDGPWVLAWKAIGKLRANLPKTYHGE